MYTCKRGVLTEENLGQSAYEDILALGVVASKVNTGELLTLPQGSKGWVLKRVFLRRLKWNGDTQV